MKKKIEILLIVKETNIRKNPESNVPRPDTPEIVLRSHTKSTSIADELHK